MPEPSGCTGTIRSIAELAKRALGAMLALVSSESLASMKPRRVSVAPMAFSQAMTASGLLSLRASMPLAMGSAMNLRMLGPTAQVTTSAVAISWTTSSMLCLEFKAR
jgi:hypothetical protein